MEGDIFLKIALDVTMNSSYFLCVCVCVCTPAPTRDQPGGGGGDSGELLADHLVNVSHNLLCANSHTVNVWFIVTLSKG